MNLAAQTLGRMAAGKPKKYSPEEIQRRTELLHKAREKRWEGHVRKEKPVRPLPD